MNLSDRAVVTHPSEPSDISFNLMVRNLHFTTEETTPCLLYNAQFVTVICPNSNLQRRNRLLSNTHSDFTDILLLRLHTSAMDESEFRQILELFPVVRSRDYHAELDTTSQISQSTPSEGVKDYHDAWNTGDKSGIKILGDEIHEGFWRKIRSVVEPKMGTTDAERFCKAFQQVYMNFVYEDLTLDAARRFINSKNS